MEHSSHSRFGSVRPSLRVIPGGAPAKESLLIFSDVHLGNDLHTQARESGFGKRSKSIDDDLTNMIRHYQAKKPEGSRWRIVINGDFIDFIGMAVPLAESGETLITEPNAEEQEHGLGNAEDHACAKLRLVSKRHADVFSALADFVLSGNTLTLVHGNHDLEFHWPAARVAFRRLLWDAATKKVGTFEEFAARIEFNPWFFYVGGVVYIEHGHQYDPYCSTDHVMAPLSPGDPRRMWRGFSEVLLRYIVRPTHGLREYGHEKAGIVDYIRFGLGLGAGGAVRVAGRFVSAVFELFRLRRANFTEAADALRAEHERRMGLVAEAARIGLDRIKALAALQAPPITRSLRGILASLLLDRVAIAMIAMSSMVATAVFQARIGHPWYASMLVLLAWGLLHRQLTHSRKIDPADDMVDRAGKLVRLFPAAFVVMGHTHVPVRIPVAEGVATYINLGSWAEEEGLAQFPAERATRTHLVVHPGEENAGPRAEFFHWDSASGPYPFGALPPSPPRDEIPRRTG